MKLHEFQAKELFGKYGVPVPKGSVAEDVDAALNVAQDLGGNLWVVKAQIHAGGRGKAGGVKVVKSLEEVKEAASELIGKHLVTHQTGPEGKLIRKVLVEQGLNIKKEFYMAITVDRANESLVIISSSAGGMEIEELSREKPELVSKVNFDPLFGIPSFKKRQIFYHLGLEKEHMKPLFEILSGLYKLFIDYDASLVEINPLVLTEEGQLIALDAKINLDDNAAYRHPEFKEWDDPEEMDPLEARAKAYQLNYIRLDGNIGAMVNGAGLAMATMDVIKLAGAEPANFLDVGGGASKEMIQKGFEIILSDPRVEAILINIFGGILRCDVLAQGVVEAAKENEIKVPLIVRLEGTNVELGRKILNESPLDFQVAADIKEAAKMVAQVVNG